MDQGVREGKGERGKITQTREGDGWGIQEEKRLWVRKSDDDRIQR